MTARLLIATTNRGKQAEFRRLLAGLPGTVVTPDELGLELEVEEPYDTYAANAAVKAAAFSSASGLPALADDSGIEVAALDWGPGVRSARWGSGPGSQADRLGRALVAADDRRARMVCVLALARPGGDDPAVEFFTGVVEGTIAREPRGENGFGYDPIFLLPSGMTTAELPEGEKDLISHRGRAVAAAMARLRELLIA
ncbi:MAG TPA: non-canonical purine NTP pyrophosphatase [Candidatus Limnocylindria bacterium]|nr:non-canonical purine NTP pyrophosphatase [Candidatus Limnocylindria bacterium]